MKPLKTTTPVLAVAFLTAASALCACARQPERKPEGPVVLGGAELRKAEAAEARRKASGEAGVSPMPAGKYEFSGEELWLVNPQPNEFDAALADLSRRYARSDAATRARMRRSVSSEEFYTLLSFAERMAVFALRERSAARLADGLSAVALVEKERVDFRDLFLPLSLLEYSAVRINADRRKLFRDAAALAEPDTADIMLLGLDAPDDVIRPARHVEIVTEGGVGLVGVSWSDPKRYEPTYDLKRAVVDAARLVVADGKYRPVTPWVGADLPEHLLKTGDDEALARALASVRAAAHVDAMLAPGLRPENEFQQLDVYLVETDDEPSARSLAEIARRKKPSDFHMLALREGRLFCLLVADATTDGAREYETPESLRRFESGLAEILRRHTSK